MNYKEDIKGIDVIVEKNGKQGLTLQYSRADFLKDLNEKLKLLSEEKRTVENAGYQCVFAGEPANQGAAAEGFRKIRDCQWGLCADHSGI